MPPHRLLTTPALAAAALGALALGACGSESAGTASPDRVSAASAAPRLDTPGLEHDLSDQLGRSAGVSPRSVACPGDIDLVKGRRFECTLTARDGERVRVGVTLTNADGGFRAVVPPQRPRAAREDDRSETPMP